MIAAGGTEVHLLVLGEHLQRLGHEVVVYAPSSGRSPTTLGGAASP